MTASNAHLPPKGSNLHDLSNLEKMFYTKDGITHDTFVKKVHSHNDYWRRRPLLDALSRGVGSVEADVWYFKGSEKIDVEDGVFVGHSINSLHPENTLDTLYLDPLYAILSGSNNKNVAGFPKNIQPDGKRQCGVWFTDCEETLYLLIDIKTDGNELFDIISTKLERFSAEGWLSWYDVAKDEFHWGPITVVGTGNTPLDRVLTQHGGLKRFIFLDGPLERLSETEDDTSDEAVIEGNDSSSGSAQGFNFTQGVSPLVSSSLRRLVQKEEINEGLTPHDFETIKLQVDIAHSRGMKTRIWDTPWWPLHLRETIWSQILSAGSDYLNLDDLSTGISFKSEIVDKK